MWFNAFGCRNLKKKERKISHIHFNINNFLCVSFCVSKSKSVCFFHLYSTFQHKDYKLCTVYHNLTLTKSSEWLSSPREPQGRGTPPGPSFWEWHCIKQAKHHQNFESAVMHFNKEMFYYSFVYSHDLSFFTVRVGRNELHLLYVADDRFILSLNAATVQLYSKAHLYK